MSANKRVRECEGDSEREEMLVREYKRLEHDHGRLLGEYAELAKTAKGNEDAFMAAAGHLCKSAERVAALEAENKELALEARRRTRDANNMTAMSVHNAKLSRNRKEIYDRAVETMTDHGLYQARLIASLDADNLEKMRVIDYVREARKDIASAFTEGREKALAIRGATPEAMQAISEEYVTAVTTKLIGWFFPNEPLELYGPVAVDVKKMATDRQREMAAIAFGSLPVIVMDKKEDNGDKEENNGAE